LLVERLAVEEGSDVALEPLLYRSEETVFDSDGLAGVKVTAKVLAHVRGEKLRVFKFKPKRGYKRRTGDRRGGRASRQGEDRRGLIRRGSARAATGATPTLSGWASRRSPGRR